MTTFPPTPHELIVKTWQIEADLQQARGDKIEAAVSERIAHENMVQLGRYWDRVTENNQIGE